MSPWAQVGLHPQGQVLLEDPADREGPEEVRTEMVHMGHIIISPFKTGLSQALPHRGAEEAVSFQTSWTCGTRFSTITLQTANKWII